MGRSQVSAFVVVALVIVILFSILLYSGSRSRQDFLSSQKIEDSGELVFSYVEDCIKETVLKGIDEIGIYSELELKKYVDINILSCVKKTSFEDFGLSVSYGNPKSSVILSENALLTSLDFSLRVDARNQRTSRNSFNHRLALKTSVPIPLEEGVTFESTSIISPDSHLSFSIPENFRVLDKEGNPVNGIEISIVPNNDPNIMGNVIYNITPDGIEFDKHLILTLDYSHITEGNPSDFSLVYYDSGLWKAVPCLNNIQEKRMICFTDHFTEYGVHGSCSANGIKEEAIYFDTGLINFERITTKKFEINLPYNPTDQNDIGCLNSFSVASFNLVGKIESIVLDNNEEGEYTWTKEQLEIVNDNPESAKSCDLQNKFNEKINFVKNIGIGKNTITFRVSPPEEDCTSTPCREFNGKFRIVFMLKGKSGEQDPFNCEESEDSSIGNVIFSSDIECKNFNEFTNQELECISSGQSLVSADAPATTQPEDIDTTGSTETTTIPSTSGPDSCSGNTDYSTYSACWQSMFNGDTINIKDEKCQVASCTEKTYDSGGATVNVGYVCFPDNNIYPIGVDCEGGVFVGKKRGGAAGACTFSTPANGDCNPLFNLFRRSGNYPGGEPSCPNGNQEWEYCNHDFKWAKYDSGVLCDDENHPWSAHTCYQSKCYFDIRNFPGSGQTGCSGGGGGSSGSYGGSDVSSDVNLKIFDGPNSVCSAKSSEYLYCHYTNSDGDEETQGWGGCERVNTLYNDPEKESCFTNDIGEWQYCCKKQCLDNTACVTETQVQDLNKDFKDLGGNCLISDNLAGRCVPYCTPELKENCVNRCPGEVGKCYSNKEEDKNLINYVISEKLIDLPIDGKCKYSYDAGSQNEAQTGMFKGLEIPIEEALIMFSEESTSGFCPSISSSVETDCKGKEGECYSLFSNTDFTIELLDDPVKDSTGVCRYQFNQYSETQPNVREMLVQNGEIPGHFLFTTLNPQTVFSNDPIEKKYCTVSQNEI